MYIYVGFVKLRMAVTTYNNISSQVTMHIEDFQICKWKLLLMAIIFSYLTEAEMTMHVTSIQKGRSTIFKRNPDTKFQSEI